MRARDVIHYLAGAGLAFILATGAAAIGARAQSCVACAAPQTLLATSANSWTLRKQVNEVEVLFTASRHGRFVDGLTRDDITVRDNNRPAEILAFRNQGNLPLRIVLLLDTSDSVKGRFQFEKEAADAFLRQVLSEPSDVAMIAGFASHFHRLQNFTHDPSLLANGLARLSPGGATAMYDAIHTACVMLAASPSDDLEARVLIVLSDGVDNFSRSRRKDAIAFAQQAEVAIYTIGTNYAETGPGTENLSKLAEQTGGRALFPVTARGMSQAFARIGAELRHRYAVAYRPAQFEANGHFRRIRIRVLQAGKKVKIRARKGYYAR
ncbi:MAG TPA: VWA domain-containing protein [Terriglobales bacterium]|nr:VWA domain-containing protein [Terriglobales bacterium]